MGNNQIVVLKALSGNVKGMTPLQIWKECGNNASGISSWSCNILKTLKCRGYVSLKKTGNVAMYSITNEGKLALEAVLS